MIEPITDDETFIRHVHPSLWPPENEKPNSGAFRDDELSIDRERLRSVQVCCQLRPDHGFMRFTVADVVAIGLVVEPDPLPPPSADAAQEEFSLDDRPPSLERNPAHAFIRGMQKSEAKKLRDRANVVFRPGECVGEPPVPAAPAADGSPAGGEP